MTADTYAINRPESQQITLAEMRANVVLEMGYLSEAVGSVQTRIDYFIGRACYEQGYKLESLYSRDYEIYINLVAGQDYYDISAVTTPDHVNSIHLQDHEYFYVLQKGILPNDRNYFAQDTSNVDVVYYYEWISVTAAENPDQPDVAPLDKQGAVTTTKLRVFPKPSYSHSEARVYRLLIRGTAPVVTPRDDRDFIQLDTTIVLLSTCMMLTADNAEMWQRFNKRLEEYKMVRTKRMNDRTRTNIAAPSSPFINPKNGVTPLYSGQYPNRLFGNY